MTPFAVATAVVFVVLVLPINSRVLHAWPAVAALALAVGIGLSVVLVPWRRLPRATHILPILGSLAVVGLLRAASGGSTSGFGGVAVLIPLLWAALYLGIFEVIGAVVGIAAMFVIPIVTIGAPDYPSTDWQRATTWVFFGAFVGLMVNRVVQRSRRLRRYVEAQEAVMHALALAGNVEAALTAALEQLGEKLSWPNLACYWAVDDGLLRCEAAWTAPDLGGDGRAFGEVSRSLVFERDEGLAGRAWSRGEAVTMTIAEAQAEAGAGPRLPVTERLGIVTGVAFPVLSGQETLGVIELFSRTQARDPELSALMTTLGSDVGNYVARRRAEAQEQVLKDQFVSLVSHELRTPLTSILGYLDLLGETMGSVDERSSRYVEVITRNAGRLKHLVDDLLFLAQVEAGRFELDLVELDLEELAAAEVETVRPEATAKDLELQLVGLAVPPIRADRMRVGQMLGNLLANAVKFTEEEGSVEVRVRPEGGGVRLEVADTGIGIPPEEQARIGERFFRSSLASAAAIGGTGLGMAIVQTIVTAHGGSFELDSEPGRGTTIGVFLPAQPPPTEASDG